MPEWAEAWQIGLFPAPTKALPEATAELIPAKPRRPRSGRRVRRAFSDRPAWLIVGAIGGALFTVIALVALGVFLSLRGGRVDAGAGGEVFYTSKATRSEAERLARYLVRAGYFDGDPKSVQLTREGRTVQVRVVVKKGIDSDPLFLGVFHQFARELGRDVFPGERVDIHLCDQWLNTLRVVPAI